MSDTIALRLALRDASCVASLVDVHTERLIHNWLQLYASLRVWCMGVGVGVSVSADIYVCEDMCVWLWVSVCNRI